ncbi:hypothetical protein WJ972_03460 [Achromobacter insuavis]
MSAAQHHPLRHRAGAFLHTGRHGLRRLAAALLAATAWAAGQPRRGRKPLPPTPPRINASIFPASRWPAPCCPIPRPPACNWS